MLLAFIALVAVPVVKAWLPSEIARWYVAGAENCLEKQQLAEANVWLDKATSWDNEIANSPEYVGAQVRRLSRQGNIVEALDLLTQNLEEEPANYYRSLAQSLSEYFLFAGDFANALSAYKIGAKDLDNRETLNRLAYYRALANTELDEALLDIDRAIAMGTDPALEDTKAWVLYHLNRPEEAREVMESAFTKTYERLASIENFLGFQEEPKNDREKVLLEECRRLIEKLHAIEDRRKRYASISGSPLGLLAVYHFHRYKIREACGRTESAEADLAWLTRHGFTDLTILY